MKPFGISFLAQVWAAPSVGMEGHAASVTQIIFPLINFLIFFYLLKRFLVPLIKEHLRSRRAEVLGLVKEARGGKERAEAAVRDYQRRMARLDEEASEIRETFRTEAEREKSVLLVEARGLAAKIKADADFLAEQEVKVARQQVRREIARLAQSAAEKIIQLQLTSVDHKRLVEEFLREVGQAGEIT
ncbi:MAG: hypothetical protein ACE5HC_00545 [Candidatus Binatia bacterium]